MTLGRFLNRFSEDLGIDLGTSNTLIYARGRGVVLNEPSVVSFNRATGKVAAVGSRPRQASPSRSRKTRYYLWPAARAGYSPTRACSTD